MSTDNSLQPNPDDLPAGKPVDKLVVRDSGEFAVLLDTARFEHMWRVAQMFSKSGMVPEHYQGKAENCMIACMMAVRMGVDPFMFMQNSYMVKGKPGLESKLVIALINSSGLFEDSLDYEIEGGDDPKAERYRVRAFAVRRSTKRRVEGPWVDWTMVNAEGWSTRSDSKWRSIPGLMFMYRAAMFFGRLHCPERLMGMQTREEMIDAEYEVIDNESPALPEAGKQSFGFAGGKRSTTAPDAPAATPVEQTPPEPPKETGKKAKAAQATVTAPPADPAFDAEESKRLDAELAAQDEAKTKGRSHVEALKQEALAAIGDPPPPPGGMSMSGKTTPMQFK